MRPVSYDIKDLLDEESSIVSALNGAIIFCNKQQAGKQTAVTIFDREGTPPQQTTDNSNYQYEAIHIIARAFSYIEAYNILQSIRHFLHNKRKEVSGTTYTAIIAQNEPTLLKWTDNDMVDLFINFKIQRK